MPSTKAKAAVKSKSKSKKFFYYRIFDDNENKNYLKSVLTHKQVERYLKAFEKTHQKYFNSEFAEHLRKYDHKVEIVEVQDISY
jgi:hypothetical protein